MSNLELVLSWLILGLESVLFLFVCLRNLQRQLPFFALHATVLLAGNVVIQLFYYNFGYSSLTSYYAMWTLIGVTVVTRGLAVVELCRSTLQAYRGIWALAWRVLTLLAVAFLGHAALDAWGQPDRVAIYGLTLELDIEIAAIILLLAMLFIRNYYGLTLGALHKSIAWGILLVCVINIANDALLRYKFAGYLSLWFFTKYASVWSGISSQVEYANNLWNTMRAFGLIISITIWCIALRKPIPGPAPAPVLLPEEVYSELSPAINLRLRTFNDRLLELLKP
jgi:hypothetical protein